jgi:acetyl esterase
MREPTYRDVRYGLHERNVMDLYLVESDAPGPVYLFIHGGGFRYGDKSQIPSALLEACIEARISLAATNYRLSGTDPYPAAMVDGTRALQFVRYKAKEWNLDSTRVAAGGGSAGAGIAFWIGFREDLADPDSHDPVGRQSTRLACIASYQAQSTYDLNYIHTIISGSAYVHPDLLQFFRLAVEEFDTPRAKKMLAETSALNYVSKDAPPVFLWYVTPDLPMTPDLGAGEGIHHPKFGRLLKRRMDALGVECVVRYREDLPGASPDEVEAQFHRELIDFVKRKLNPA